jgi:SOS-response transcriptional repressor LexA
MMSNPDDHFLVKVSGYSMKDAGILPDDILLVNKSKEARDGDIIIASVDNGAVVKRLSQKNGVTKLVSENDDYPDIEDEEQNFHFWGVVAKVIREY